MVPVAVPHRTLTLQLVEVALVLSMMTHSEVGSLTVTPPAMAVVPARHEAVAVAEPLPGTATVVPVRLVMDANEPVGPVDPVAPVAPLGPVAPVGPVAPIPVGPVAPDGPVGPVAPVGPGTVEDAPVGPVAPVAPVDPLGPVTP